MKDNRKTVLFSPVGTTDPISYQREGALLHICRHYHPECVVLYLSQEMLAQQQKDDRYRRSLRLLAEEEGFETEILCEERPEMDSPHLFDVFYEDFERCIHTLHERYPGRRILLNLSSGTPAMKSALAVLPYLIDLPVCGIQVSSPQKAHNDKREPLQEYDVDLAWEYNLDRKSEEFVDRCKEPKMENLRAKPQRRTLEAHLEGIRLCRGAGSGPAKWEICCRTAHGNCCRPGRIAREKRMEKDCAPAARTVRCPGLARGKGHFGVHVFAAGAATARGSGEFLRRPHARALSAFALRAQKSWRKSIWRLAAIRMAKYSRDLMKPQLYATVDEIYNGRYTPKEPSSDLCIKLLAKLCPQHACVFPLRLLRDVEKMLRNTAAHTIQPVPEEVVRQKSREILAGNGYAVREEGSQAILRLLHDAAEAVFERGPLGWDAYDRMNDAIRAALDEAPAL